MVGVSDQNLKIIKKHFQFIEVDKITEETAEKIGNAIGLDFSATDISIKSDWKKYKKYFCLDKNKKPLMFIKDIWETGGFKEVVALHLAKYVFDPELVPDNYLFGLHYGKRFTDDPQPFLATTIVPGEPIKKHEWEPHAFELGRQFYLHQILSLYDCDLRHFLVHENQIRRIDLGLAFYHITTRYRGFEEYMPKGLPYMRKFWRGYDYEEGKIKVMLLNTREKLKPILNDLKMLREDDIIDFDPIRFMKRLLNYWQVEKLPILDFPSHSKDPSQEPNV